MDVNVNPFSADDGPATTRSRMSGLLRATQVLDRLVVEGKSTSAYDLAKAIHAPVSTIYGVVDALVQAGLLERDTAGAVWFGSRMYHYGLAYGRNVDLLREARIEMRRLSQELGETVQICARHEGFVVIQLERFRPVLPGPSSAARAGRHLPAERGALGDRACAGRPDAIRGAVR
jgi:DNA-binding IclR family transcriptional regulator